MRIFKIEHAFNPDIPIYVKADSVVEYLGKTELFEISYTTETKVYFGFKFTYEVKRTKCVAVFTTPVSVYPIEEDDRDYLAWKQGR